MSNKLKVAIVGCGAIAEIRHLPSFMRLRKNIVVQAACDRNEDLARKLARTYGIPRVYSDTSEMLAKEALDIVDICTPPQVHASLAIEALEHGCHVLLEKPMALKTSECDEMIAASLKDKVKLCVIHNQLFYPPVLKARELIARKVIGDFIGMRIFMSDPKDEMIMRKDYWVHKLPGGVIGESGPHAVYKSLPFIGKVKSVDVHARSLLEHPWAPFDEFRIELEGEKANSSVFVSYASDRRASSVDLLGTNGALHLDLLGMLCLYQSKNASMKPFALARYYSGMASQIIGGVALNAFSMLAGRTKLGHEVVIEGFVNSILNNSQPPVTGEEGREVIRVMEMIVNKLQEKYGH
jgi:predicted dehydrogenase